jgi:dTDP-4-dehydrorhamnose reductase
VRLLVTGGSGYLGGELIGQARRHGWPVTGTSLTSAGDIRLDVRDAAAVRDAVAATRPEAIVHTAYRQDGEGAWETTVDGTANVARVAAGAGVRLLHLSTDVVFDGRLGRPYREDDPPTPVTAYGRAKARAEEAVSAADGESLVVRTSLIVAGAQPSRHERIALDVAAGRTEMAFYTDEVRCPIAVSDLAAALLELAPSTATGLVHVAGADAVSRHELAVLVTGRRGLAGARSAERPDPRPLDCRLDCRRAAGLLGRMPRGVRELYGARRSTSQSPSTSRR